MENQQNTQSAKPSQEVQPVLPNPTQDKPAQSPGNKARIITTETYIRSVNRAPKDILSYRAALQSAESVYYPNRMLLYDLYHDIELDGFLTGIVNKRIDSAINKTLLYKDAGDEVVEDMNKLIYSEKFREMLRQLLLTKMWGITGIEFIPGAEFDFNRIPRKHIKPKWRRITIQQSGTDGFNYDDFWNIWVVGDAHDLGLYLQAAFYCLLKKGVISDWAEYIEMYGLPVTVLKYEGYDQQAKIEGKKILDEAGSALRLLVPKNMEYDIKDGARSNSEGGLQNSFIEYVNKEISILIVGNTETTQSSKSSGYAQSKTHQEQQKEIQKSDMLFLTDLLNSEQFIRILQSYGLPVVEGGHWEFDREVDIDFLERKIKIDAQVVLSNPRLPISDDYWYETYAIPKPKDYEARKKELETQEPEPDPDDPAEDTENGPEEQPKQKQKVAKKSLKAWFSEGMRFFVHAPASRG